MNQFEQINVTLTFSVAIPSNQVIGKNTADEVARYSAILLSKVITGDIKDYADRAYTPIHAVGEFESWGKPMPEPVILRACDDCPHGKGDVGSIRSTYSGRSTPDVEG